MKLHNQAHVMFYGWGPFFLFYGVGRFGDLYRNENC